MLSSPDLPKNPATFRSKLRTSAPSRLSAMKAAAGCAAMEGSLRLVDGEKTSTFEYGRLEIFLNGFWSNICDIESFTPDSAQVACSILGYDGGTPLNFRQAYIVGSDRESQVMNRRRPTTSPAQYCVHSLPLHSHIHTVPVPPV